MMNIYVGNLSDQVSADDLRQSFEAYGQVSSIKIIKDKFTDRPLGFGFIEMPGHKQGLQAIESLNLTEIGGRSVIAAETAERTERRKSGGTV
jgi:RNA recognition motif-containing protein